MRIWLRAGLGQHKPLEVPLLNVLGARNPTHLPDNRVFSPSGLPSI